MLTLSAAIIYVATKCLDQFIKEEGYGRIRLFFFPKEKYINRLRDRIMGVVDDFAATDNISYKSLGKIPFYHSPEVFQAVIDHVLFKEIDLDAVILQIENNTNVLPPKTEDVKRFFESFYKKVKSDSKLKKIFLEENYKAEIFQISSNLDQIGNQINNVALGVASLEAKMDILQSNSIRPEVPVIATDYLSSPEESSLYNILDRQNILLLTGVSFCGKSQLGKKIAEKFVQIGYKYQGGTNVDEADRFLRILNGNHIFLLEDPFGHNIESESKINLRRVEELTRNMAPGNKLIVTSRSEVLISTKGVRDTKNCAIEGHNWCELTSRGREFLKKVWDKLSINVPESCRSLIANHINSAPNAELLQVGQLAHLSRLPKDTLIEKPISTLLHFAKADSKTLSVEIKARGKTATHLYYVMGLAASTTQGISLDNLAYLLSDSDNYPGLLKKQNFRTHNPKDSVEVHYPTYDQQYNLSSVDKAELIFFIERGYLQISNEQVYFRHPTYQEAARYILVETSHFEIENTLEKIKRTIGCLNQKNSSYLASHFSDIVSSVQNPEFRNGIIKLAYKCANRSIFPSVRDWLLKLLLEYLPTVDEEMQDGIFRLIDADMSSSDIFWEDDQPFYSKFDRNWLDEDTFDESSTKSTIDRLTTNEDISTFELWAVVLLLSKPDFSTTDFPDAKGLDRILNAQETFIRSKIAFLILNRLPFIEQKILDRIFNDGNPWVVVEAIKGAIFGYPFYTPEQRVRILPMLQQAVGNSFVISRIRTLLTSFGIDYGLDHIDWERIDEEHKLPMWELWAMIFPTFMEKMPITVSINNSGRFGQTMDAATQYLKNTPSGLRVAEAYYHWVDARICNGITPDTHELAVISFLLEISDDHAARLPLFIKILTYPKSSLTLYSLSWAISDWKNLSVAERQIILELCVSERSDRRWIIATAITRRKVPAEIQQQIFNRPDFLEQPADKIVSQLSPNVLTDALDIYIGESYLIGYLGLSHSENGIWHEIIEHILRTGHQPDFRFCLQEFILHVINGPAREWRNSYLDIWKEMCSKDELKNILSETLILETAKSNPSIPPCTDLWKELIAVHNDDSKSELAGKVAEAIEAIQKYDASDLFEFFDPDFFDMIVNNHCPLDLKILSFLLDHKNSPSIPQEEVDRLADEVAADSQNQHLRLELTFDQLKKLHNRQVGTPRFLELEKLPDLIYEKDDQWLKSKRAEREIGDWIT